MVDGEIVLANGEPTRVDMTAFRAELIEIMAQADKDYAALASRQSVATPYLLKATRNLNKADLGLNRFSGTVLTSDKN